MTTSSHNGGRYRTRTCDPLRVKHIALNGVAQIARGGAKVVQLSSEK